MATGPRPSTCGVSCLPNCGASFPITTSMGQTSAKKPILSGTMLNTYAKLQRPRTALPQTIHTIGIAVQLPHTPGLTRLECPSLSIG